MAFDTSSITSVRHLAAPGYMELFWTSSAPVGTTFQVYVRGVRAWSGTARSCILPRPAEGRARVVVGAVGPGEAGVDFASSLPPTPADRASLSWLGGTYLDATGGDDVVAFRVYASAIAGGPVDRTSPVADLAAYEEGVIADGWGLGGWGEGGWGKAATRYAWTSPPLTRGTWSYEVLAVDAVGSESPAAAGSVAIGGPPGPPARDAVGRRLTVAYDPLTRIAVLSWLPSEA